MSFQVSCSINQTTVKKLILSDCVTGRRKHPRVGCFPWNQIAGSPQVPGSQPGLRPGKEAQLPPMPPAPRSHPPQPSHSCISSRRPRPADGRVPPIPHQGWRSDTIHPPHVPPIQLLALHRAPPSRPQSPAGLGAATPPSPAPLAPRLLPTAPRLVLKPRTCALFW
ncbi:hypothetical protein KIL84_017573 [Mauremys mutica]|uniref:Uncharacterized protein n=1 Tax=Mauremys mutica TaxID=74926 RepID=A0A9D3X4J4_9SAUR|nr:hypothetical protein KIL84_017573 [Mauremys mutica]